MGNIGRNCKFHIRMLIECNEVMSFCLHYIHRWLDLCEYTRHTYRGGVCRSMRVYQCTAGVAARVLIHMYHMYTCLTHASIVFTNVSVFFELSHVCFLTSCFVYYRGWPVRDPPPGEHLSNSNTKARGNEHPVLYIVFSSALIHNPVSFILQLTSRGPAKWFGLSWCNLGNQSQIHDRGFNDPSKILLCY